MFAEIHRLRFGINRVALDSQQHVPLDAGWRLRCEHVADVAPAVGEPIQPSTLDIGQCHGDFKRPLNAPALTCFDLQTGQIPNEPHKRPKPNVSIVSVLRKRAALIEVEASVSMRAQKARASLVVAVMVVADNR